MPEWPKPLSMRMMMMNNMYLRARAAGRVHGQAKSRTGPGHVHGRRVKRL